MESQPALSKKQMKLRGNFLSITLPRPSLQGTKRIFNSHSNVYSSLLTIPSSQRSTRALGNSRTSKAEWSYQKYLEKDFLLLRKHIDMGEFQKSNHKPPFKSRRQKMKEQLQRAVTPPSPKNTSIRSGRLKSSVRAQGGIDHAIIKKMSVSDFRRTKLPGYISFVCRRKDHPEDLLDKTRSAHCDLFGPGLCPDCQRLEGRYDFTLEQDELFPYLDVTSRSLVAVPKLKNQSLIQERIKMPPSAEFLQSLRKVYSEIDIHKRLARNPKTVADVLTF